MSRKFKVSRSVIVALLAVLVLAVGCGTSKEVNLDANDDGSQVEIEKGQTLVIALEASPTTGYTWEAVELDEHILRQVGEPEFEPQSDAVGAPGIQTIRFEAVGAGPTTLRLGYRRPWEENVEPVETFSIQVVVR